MNDNFSIVHCYENAVFCSIFYRRFLEDNEISSPYKKLLSRNYEAVAVIINLIKTLLKH